MPSRRQPEALRDSPASPTDVHRLILSHLHIVRNLVKSIKETVPSWVRRSDLLSAGLLGLVRAARNWNPARGVSFAWYSRFRIRGAILDELRFFDHVFRRKKKIANGTAIPAKLPLGKMDIVDRRPRQDPMTHSEFPDGLIRALDDRERKILHLRYTQDMSLTAIADVIGCSAKCVSYIHMQLKRKAQTWYESNGIALRA